MIEEAHMEIRKARLREAGDLPNDLPPVDTKRWVISRKARVLQAIEDGVLSRAQACARYNISEAELRLWERAVACAGVPGLRVTRVQVYRDAFEAGQILPSANPGGNRGANRETVGPSSAPQLAAAQDPSPEPQQRS